MMEYTNLIDQQPRTDTNLDDVQRLLNDLELDEPTYAESVDRFCSIFHMKKDERSLEQHFGPWDDELKTIFTNELKELTKEDTEEGFYSRVNEIYNKNTANVKKFITSKNKIELLVRHVITGIKRPSHQYPSKKGLDDIDSHEELFRKLISEIIKAGCGNKLLDIVKNLNQFADKCIDNETFVRLLVILSLDKSLKKDALKMVPLVCNIPQRLFFFVYFRTKMLNQSNGGERNRFTGWDKDVRRAVSAFYLDRNRLPRNLLLLCSRYKQRYGWNHRKILTRCHAKVQGASVVASVRSKKHSAGRGGNEDPFWKARNLVICYLTRGLEGVKKQYEKLKELPTPIKQDDTEDIYQYIMKLEHVKKLPVNNESVKELVKLIPVVNHRLTIEHLNTKFLTRKEVWEAMLHYTLAPFSIVHNLGLMSSLNLFDDKEPACQKNITRVINMLKKPEDLSKIGPLKLLMASSYYEIGKGDHMKKRRKKKTTWKPNMDIEKALFNAVVCSFKACTDLNTSRNIAIIVDNRKDMFEFVLPGSQLKAIAGAAVCVYALWSTCREVNECSVYNWKMKKMNCYMKNICQTKEILDMFQQESDVNLDSADTIIKALDLKNKDTFIIITSSTPHSYQEIEKKLKVCDEVRLNTKKKGKKFKQTKLVVCYMGETHMSDSKCADNPYILTMSGIDLGHVSSYICDDFNCNTKE